MWTFDESVTSLDHLPRETLVPAHVVGVRRIAFLLARLDNPDRGLHVVHVAGSSGKGSTSAMIAAALLESGYSVGLFRSPHLVSYRERIAVDGVDVDERSWLVAFAKVWPVAEAMSTNAYTGYDLGRPSHGEILLAMALLLFRSAAIEWAVVETGMGGRLDATNVLKSDVAVVTNISLEHTQILGSTIFEIAGEKAAIIKTGSVAVTGATDPTALKVITDRASSIGATLIQANRSVHVSARNQSIQGQHITVEGQHWQFDTPVSLAGSYQVANITTAVAALEALQASAPKLDAAATRRALSTVRIPGRLEVVGTRPLIVLDGAHSTAGTEALGVAIDELLNSISITLLFGAMVDKDLNTMAQAIGPRVDRIIVTRAPGSSRAASIDRLLEAFRGHSDVTGIENADNALAAALELTPASGALVVAGSLYLVGHVRALLLHTEVVQ